MTSLVYAKTTPGLLLGWLRVQCGLLSLAARWSHLLSLSRPDHIFSSAGPHSSTFPFQPGRSPYHTPSPQVFSAVLCMPSLQTILHLLPCIQD